MIGKTYEYKVTKFLNLNFEDILCIRKDLIVMGFVSPPRDLHFGWIRQGKTEPICDLILP